MRRILFLTGGPRFHPVDEQAQLIEGWLADHTAHRHHEPFECIRLPGPSALEALDRPLDLLVVMGLFWPGMSADWAGNMTYHPLTPSHERLIDRYIASGKPVIAHHGGIASYPESEPFARLCGWAWIWETTTHSPIARWRTTLRNSHPITQHAASFDITDEIYYRVKELEPHHTQVHATAHFEAHDHPMISTLEATPSRGRRVYLANGHDLRSFAPESMRRIWLNAIEWCLESR